MEREEDYQVINGTAYHKDTPEEVISWLETSRERKQRIRIFYGDRKTGRDWKEECDTMGYIGRSTGRIKIPILLHNSRSTGGTAVLDHCIVKITTVGSDNKPHTVYQHKNYHLCNKRTIKKMEKDHPYSVILDGEEYACFKTLQEAKNFLNFLEGKRNKL